MKYKLIMFDFDGTLADSFPWFLGVINKVADKYKFKRPEEKEHEALRNANALQVLDHLGIPLWKVPMIGAHLQKLMAQDVSNITLFDGIEQLLQRLADTGATLAVLSSNSYDNICQVLGAQNASLFKYFECGASIFGKPPKIKKILKQHNTSQQDAILIGDEIRDIEAAHRANIASGAVGWGYNRLEALLAYSPQEAFASIEEIFEKIIHPKSLAHS